MNIAIIGSGGREHAFADKISRSSRCSKLYVLPGNAGTAALAQNVNIDMLNFDAVADFCIAHAIDMLVVGPEVPLVLGLRDALEQRTELSNMLIIGPGASGARLEGSKDFSKEFMFRHHIPTASARTFTQAESAAARDYVSHHSLPVVIKADGPAAGKGVIIALDKQTALDAVDDILVKSVFGEAGAKILVEQFLTGIELSVFVLTDGTSYITLPEAKDYKRIGEGDTGLNTGGMGAISPVPFADAEFMQKIDNKIIKPTIQGLQSEQIDYLGFIFFGLIKVGNEPYVIEYNARMGDPETEAVLPRINSDLVELLEAAGKRQLKGKTVETDGDAAATVVLVSGGYPGNFAKGKKITFAPPVNHVTVYHAGTVAGANGEVLTAGGRVLAITGRGASKAEALQRANAMAESIQFEAKNYRKDIGFDL